MQLTSGVLCFRLWQKPESCIYVDETEKFSSTLGWFAVFMFNLVLDIVSSVKFSIFSIHDVLCVLLPNIFLERCLCLLFLHCKTAHLC